MNTQESLPMPRRRILGLGLILVGLALAGCAPQQPPAPGSWAEEYQRRKEKYRQWGQGHDNASAR